MKINNDSAMKVNNDKLIKPFSNLRKGFFTRGGYSKKMKIDWSGKLWESYEDLW